MVVLRSREIKPAQSIPKTLTESSTPEPQTPSQIDESSIQSLSPSLTANIDHDHDQLAPNSVSVSQSNRRRSLRLASISVSGSDSIQNGSRRRKRAASSLSVEERSPNLNAQGNGDFEDVDGNSSGIMGLRSGKRIVRKGLEYSDGRSAVEIERVERGGDESVVVTGKELEEKVLIDDGNESNQELRGNVDGVEKMISPVSPVNKKLKGKLNVDGSDNSSGRKRSKVEGTEKPEQETVIAEGQERNQITNESNNAGSSRRYSRGDKGKGKLVDGESSVNVEDMPLHQLESLLEELRAKAKDLVDNLNLTGRGQQANNSSSPRTASRMERFRDVARKSASRFAHFEPQEQQGENSSARADVEIPSVEESEKVEDWPGPFSTAMKIIRDRANKLNSQRGSSTSQGVKSVPITWVPREKQGSSLSRAHVPSLLNLCMDILVQNVEAVTSLDHVPDQLRHRLCQMLCDCRRMSGSFLELLVCGSPTEIRIKDCSWLTEEEFTKCFGGCDTSNLSVLQLDQCGRCIADYLLPGTLARSSRSMPALSTLSLSGACRLTDTGLGSLLSAAPALRSINLSQCSLLTSDGISTLAQSLGSHLQELYMDDCQSLDAMLILPSLKKLHRLEVLSVAGIQAVSDKFVQEFINACGHNMKELVLANCTNLTDSAVKVIAETCPNLCALDLVNLSKLTDATLGYLANSCRKIQTLKFCRNTFSDEAVAAYLETSGEPLKELSLNNITEVRNNTALALARRSRNLERLDLSWCRKLTDEAMGLIVDSCSSLRVLKLFGCGQITNVFLNGHSNEKVEIIGLKLSPVLEHVQPNSEEFPLRYASALLPFCSM